MWVIRIDFHFFEEIPKWNNKNSIFHNGVLLYFIGGEIFPKRILNATLSSEILQLKYYMNPEINKGLYEGEKTKSFVEMYNITYPEDENVLNDYRYDFTPLSFSDAGCFAFLVSNGHEIRILASELKYNLNESIYALNNINIIETFITNDEFCELGHQLDNISIQWNL